MLANIIVEIPWALFSAILLFFTWYYPIGLYNNAAQSNATTERGALTFLLILTFLWFSSTFAHMIISGIDTAETAGNVGNLLFSLSLLFCGVLVGPTAPTMQHFWIFMYRISPFTYLVEGLLSTAVSGASVQCAENEFLRFSAPAGATCNEYVGQFAKLAGGYLLDGNASQCAYCPTDNTDAYLAQVSIYYEHAWRDFGLMFVYIGFNLVAALGIYWLARVPKKPKAKKEKTA